MKVSIIVPIYNALEYLEKCLSSIVNQTYQNIEIILINDGSTDNSEKIIEDYQKKYSNIISINISNHGQGYARNLGIKKATGDAIMFIDSDDYVDKEIVYKLVNSLEDSDVSVCNIKKVINGKEELFINYHEYKNDQINFMLSHPGPVAKLYRKRLFDNVCFMENVYYEDLSFTPVIAMNIKKVSFVNEALYYYVIHSNSTMKQTEYNPKINSIFEVIDYLSSQLNDYERELEYIYIEHLLYSATLRYLDYDNCNKELEKINKIMDKWPNWKENSYYKKKSWKFKLICKLAKNGNYKLIKFIKKVSGK